MRNKANFRKSQMFITVVPTMNYNEKLAMDTWSKQSQTKPTCPERGRRVYSESAGAGEAGTIFLGFVCNCVQLFLQSISKQMRREEKMRTGTILNAF